jgi:enamine deaminase RidA (YjgF/YER057c/UK114 family)
VTNDGTGGTVIERGVEATNQVLQPPGWAPPRGYANGVAARTGVSGTQVYVAGQIGWNAQQVFVSDDLVAQVRQALANVRAVLAQAGAEPHHLVRMTWYLTDKREYLARAREIGAAYRETIGHYAVAMSAVQVAALIEDRAKVEIEATAVIPG